MFTATLRIDRLTSALLPLATDSRALHRLVMSGFPDLETPRPRRALHVLFHTESPLPGSLVITVRADVAPHWTDLPLGIEASDARAETPAIATGQQIHIVADLNPTWRPSVPQADRARRVNRRPLTDPAALRAWWDRQGDHHGFAVQNAQFTSLGRRRGEGGVDIAVMQVISTITITDATQFTAAYQDGIGPAKAFGCGMIRILPAPLSAVS